MPPSPPPSPAPSPARSPWQSHPLLALVDERVLREAFDGPTLARGRAYAEAGHVESLGVGSTSDRDRAVLNAAVSGTRRYQTLVWLQRRADEAPAVRSHCTCPVGELCKHAVAVLVAARSAPAGEWERQLGPLLEDLERQPTGAATYRPVALQLDLREPRQGRWQAADARPVLRLRPLQQGARDNWVRQGFGWRDLELARHRREHDPDQLAVLAELAAATRAVVHWGNEVTSLSEFGPSLWPLLRRAGECGIPIVAGAGLGDVRVLDAPVEVGADLVTSADGAELSLGVRHDDRWWAGDELVVLGDTSHGVALLAPPEQEGRRAPTRDVVLAPLATPASRAVRRMLDLDSRVRVPARDHPRLVREFLPRLSRHLAVRSSDDSVPVPVHHPPRLALRITWHSADRVGLSWAWRYRVDDDEHRFALDASDGFADVRDPLAERELGESVRGDGEIAWLLFDAQGRPASPRLLDGSSVLRLPDALPVLEAHPSIDVEEHGERPHYRESRSDPDIRFDVLGDATAPGAASGRTAGAEAGDEHRGPTDWLDLAITVSIEGEEVPLPMVLEALTRDQELLILPSGLLVRTDHPQLARLAGLVHEARRLHDDDTGLRVGRHDLGLWGELADLGVVDAQAKEWVEAARALRDLEELPAVEPEGLTCTLRPYQLDGFRWLALLWRSRLGGVLADDMGLGKTLQVLALVSHARARGAAPFLVVAPTSVVAAWQQEADRHAPGLVVRTVTAAARRRSCPIAELAEGADVVVTSYTLLRLEASDYAALDWGGLVLDEAQHVKNHQGKTHQAVRKIDAPFRLVVTGTPFENRLMELWALLSIAAPGLYPWPKKFAEQVAVPVERHGDREALDRFRRRIRPLMLRRTKEHVARDLPPKQEQVLAVDLSARHRRVYDTHLQHERQRILGLVDDFERNRVAIFRSLTRLRQLSLDPALVDADHEGVGSAKLDVLVAHLQELVAEGHRALVFSQFTGYLRRVRARLDREGIPTTYLDGRTRDRVGVVGDFKAGDGAVFLISLKAGGVGLTLTEADYVFVLDPWWNPAVEAQAVDRAHRIGQDRPVMVYRLVSTGTIEEKVMALKERKAALFAQVVDGEGTGSATIGADDVRELLADESS